MGVLLDRRVALILILVYLIMSSVNELVTIASRVIRWASAWHRPALSIAVTARLAWTGHRQAQRLWVSARALVRRQVLRPRSATVTRRQQHLGQPLAQRYNQPLCTSHLESVQRHDCPTGCTCANCTAHHTGCACLLPHCALLHAVPTWLATILLQPVQ